MRERHAPALTPLPAVEEWRPLHPRSQEQTQLAHHAQRYDRYQQVLALRSSRGDQIQVTFPNGRYTLTKQIHASQLS